MKDFVIIIPARLASTRFPRKPLYKILGKELIIHVADNCTKNFNKKNLIIATDSREILRLSKSKNYNSILTSKSCLTGTDRIAEVSKKIKSKIYINVQGDEPLVNCKDIQKIISTKKKFPEHIVCGMTKISKLENPKNISIPKVIFNNKNELIYISRNLIPFSKDNKKITNFTYYKQVCIYAFNYSELSLFSKKKTKTKIEEQEDIEIIRFLEMGKKIKMVDLNCKTIAVDFKKDVKKVEEEIKKNIKLG